MKKLIILLMLCFAMILTMTPTYAQTSTPEIFIDPIESTADIGETFIVNVNISNAVGVFSWEVRVRFDPTILVVSSCSSGGFLERGGSTFPLSLQNKSDLGYVVLGLTLSEPGSASGNGTLVKITFKVLSGGYSAIDLYDTHLYDEYLDEISHTATDGSFVLTNLILVPAKGIAAFTIKGFGFAPSSAIEIKWNNTLLTTIPEKITSDSKGNFVAIAAVPEQTNPGNYTISAEDSLGKKVEAIFEVVNVQGPPGATGPQGPQGEKGEQGEQGPSGPAAPMEYTWLAVVLSIVAMLLAAYSVFSIFKKR